MKTFRLFFSVALCICAIGAFAAPPPAPQAPAVKAPAAPPPPVIDFTLPNGVKTNSVDVFNALTNQANQITTLQSELTKVQKERDDVLHNLSVALSLFDRALSKPEVVK